MAPLATAFVRLRTDTSTLGSEVRHAGDKAGTEFGQRFSARSKVALAGLGVGILAGVGAALRTGVGEVKEYQTGLSNLQAGLKSTGGIAGLTASEMESLAARIQDYSGQTDDSIVATEQLLLTFTNIRDVAGKNNDIFTQTTEIAADMAQRLGGDASSAAIQLGKALNDPVKGLTALTRVGVSFTEQQKAQVAAMVKSGDTLGAQKLILGELRREFGGSARAFGATDAGQIEKAKREWEDLSQTLTTDLLPAFRATVGAIKDTTHFIQENESWLKPLAITIGGAVAAWKAYTAAMYLAAAANAAFTGSAVAAGAAGAAGGAGAAAGASRGGAAKAGLIGLAGLGSFELTTSALHHLFGDRFGADAKPSTSAGPETQKLIDQYGSLDAALAALKVQNAGVTASEKTLTGATGKHTGAVGDETRAMRRQARELGKSQHDALDLAGAHDTLASAVHNMAVQAAGGHRALTGNSDAALANRDAVRGAVTSSLDYLQVLKDSGAPRARVLRQERDLAKAIKDNARETYGDKQAVDKLLRSLGFMPDQIQAVIDKYNELHQVAFNPVQGTGKNSPFLDPGHPGYVAPAVKDNAKKTGETLGTSVTTGFSSVVDPGIAEATAQAAKDAAKAAAQAAHEALQAARSRMRQDFQSIKQDFASQKQSLISAFGSLSTTPGTDSLGASFAKPPSVNSQLRADARQMETFAHLWHRLDRDNLDPRLLAQFAGPEYIPAMRQLLQSGQRGIRRANRFEGRIARAAGSIASATAGDQYGRLIHNDLEELPIKLARRFAKELRGIDIHVRVSDVDRSQGHRAQVS